MAKEERDKYDLKTLAWKQKLIGADIVDEDGVSHEIEDYYFDDATNEFHFEFTDGTSSSFSSKRKYVVKIESSYKSIKSKKKIIKAKKSRS